MGVILSSRNDPFANYCSVGLQGLRRVDTFTTCVRIKSDYFLNEFLPKIAEGVATTCLNTFGGYLPRGDHLAEMLRSNHLPKLLLTELNLYINKERFNICFIPPGAPYDPQLMEAETEVGYDHIVEEESHKYRVRMGTWPLLVAIPKELDNEPSASARENYKKALLESWSFFPDTPGQYRWEEMQPRSRAAAIIQ